MKHLTVDEIIEFVSLNELNNDAVKLIGLVNEHIRECEKCRRLVRAFQMVYDEFSRVGSDSDFKKTVLDVITNDASEIEKAVTESAFEEFDGYK